MVIEATNPGELVRLRNEVKSIFNVANLVDGGPSAYSRRELLPQHQPW